MKIDNKINRLIGLCNDAVQTGYFDPEIDTLANELKNTQGYKDNYISNLVVETKREVKDYHFSNMSKLSSQTSGNFLQWKQGTNLNERCKNGRNKRI